MPTRLAIFERFAKMQQVTCWEEYTWLSFFWWFFTSCHGNSVKQYESICMCLLVLRSQAFPTVLQVPVPQSDLGLLPRLIDFVAASIKRIK